MTHQHLIQVPAGSPDDSGADVSDGSSHQLGQIVSTDGGGTGIERYDTLKIRKTEIIHSIVMRIGITSSHPGLVACLEPTI